MTNKDKLSKMDDEKQKLLKTIREAIENVDNSEDAPIVIFISKMVAVPRENINEHGLSFFTKD